MASYSIDPSYMKKQTNINGRMRHIIIKWMIFIAAEKRLQPRTTNMAIILLDKYLSMTNVMISDLVAISCVCLLIATKMEETKCLKLEYLIKICDELYTEKYLLDLEISILNKLSYRLIYQTCYSHIKFNGVNLCKLDMLFALYILFHLLLSPNYLAIKPDIWASKIIRFVLLSNNFNKLVRAINKDTVMAYIYTKITHPKKCIQQYLDIGYVSLPKIKRMHNILFVNRLYMNPKQSKQYQIYTATDIANIKHIKHLGRGRYGSVSHVEFNGEDIALKVSNIFPDRTDGVSFDMLREVNSLMLLQHENIIKLEEFGYIDNKFYIGMELIQTTLHNILESDRPLNVNHSYIIQLLNGLVYLHDNYIIHRDLTTPNILINNDDTLKIADFGFSRFYLETDTNGYTSKICGLSHRPIEILAERSYTEKVDVWSAACIIGAVLQRNYLFEGKTSADVLESIFKHLGTPTKSTHPDVYYWFGKPPDPIHKFSGFFQLEKSFKPYASVIYKMLNYNPVKRITAAKALKLFQKIEQ